MEKNKETVISTFLKFSKIEYLEEFRSGKLHMNNLNFFKTHEESKEIGDKDEGIKMFFPQGKYSISFKPYNSNKTIEAVPISDGIMRTNEYENIHLFCLYTIYEANLSENFRVCLPKKIIEEKNYDHYLLITKPSEFFKRVDNALKKINLPYYSRQPVKYINKKEHYGEMNLFMKFDDYKHQNEYRIAVKLPKSMRDLNNAFKLDIGDISDISIIGKTEYIDKELMITPLKYSNLDKN